MLSPVGEAPPLREQVYESLRRAILVGVVSPGSQLSPASIAEDLGISTMPVREALRLLEDDGLVETSARRWTRVRTLSLSEAEELYPLVGVLEEYAIGIGPEPSRKQIAAMRRANKALRAAARADDVLGCLDADERLHAALVERCGNASALRIISECKARMRLLEGAYYRDESLTISLEQHESVIAAAADGDLAKAGRLIRKNWEHGLRGVRAVVLAKQAENDAKAKAQ
jgi:DNA-binding GntR family transcriptional regulator